MVARAGSRYFELSVTDRVLALITASTGAAPHLVLELGTPLDRTLLARAVNLIAEQHPILTCTVDIHAPGARWEPGGTAPVLAWAHSPTETAALDAGRGPTCHVVHEQTATGHRLRFGVHHAVADGVGLLLLADDLRRLYCALAEDEDHRPDVDWNPRTLPALLDAHRIGIGERTRLAWDAGVRWNRVPRSTHGVPDGPPHVGTRPLRDPSVAPWSCSADILDHIVAIGRDRGWRRAPVAVASLAAAWSRAFGDEPGPAASVWFNGVNCRRQLGTSRGIGNLSGFEPVTLHDVAARPLPDIVDEATVAFTPFRDLGAGMVGELGAPLLDVVPTALLDRAAEVTFEQRAQESRWTRALSVVDIPETLADWGDVHAVAGWCEPVRTMTGPSTAFVVTRFHGRLCYTPAASEDALGTDDTDRLFGELDTVHAELAARVGAVA
jgi:hypothetical protein